MTVRMKSPQCQVQVTRSSTREMLRHLEAENGELRGMIELLQADVTRLEAKNERLREALQEYLRDFGDNEDADSQRMAAKARAALEQKP